MDDFSIHALIFWEFSKFPKLIQITMILCKKLDETFILMINTDIGVLLQLMESN